MSREDFAKLYRDIGPGALAKALGVHRNTITNQARRIGLKPCGKKVHRAWMHKVRIGSS